MRVPYSSICEAHVWYIFSNGMAFGLGGGVRVYDAILASLASFIFTFSFIFNYGWMMTMILIVLSNLFSIDCALKA